MERNTYKELNPAQLKSQVNRTQELIFEFTQKISQLRKDLKIFDQSLNY